MAEAALASPNCAFKIPSLHDGLEIDCRLYFPRRLSGGDSISTSAFAIFAHPYAPLGGCYDDPTVQLVASALLKQGFIVCTFNFRGAAGSPGSTSWTGKPELADYVSVYAFMFHLISRTEVVQSVEGPSQKPTLILGGYSYGSMIASHLPSLETVRGICSTAKENSYEREIATRAREMAEILQAHVDAHATHKRNESRVNDVESDSSKSVMVGGYDSQRLSSQFRRESLRNSVDHERVRHSIDRLKGKFNMNKRKTSDLQQSQGQYVSNDDEIQAFDLPEIGYLLISPLLQPVSGFTTIFSSLTFDRKHSNVDKTDGPWETNLCKNPTMAIFGDRDTFTSASKLRKWTQELHNIAHSRFESHEITGAGHFWQETEIRKQLFTTISKWSGSLCSGDKSVE